MLDKKSLAILSEAIKFCCSISLNGTIYNENDECLIEFGFSFEIQEMPNEITLNSKIEFCREDDYNEDSCSKMKVGEFIELYSDISSYKLVNNSIVYGKNLALFCVAGSDDYTVAKLVKNPIDSWCHTKIFIDSKEYRVEFLSERQVIFDILLLKEQVFDKELSPYTEDCFIKISSANELDRKIAQNLAEALIFELATTHKIYLTHAKIIGGLDLDSIETNNNIDGKMFPLLTGKGIPELLNLYNKTIGIDNSDYAILSLVKIIEYVAPTVVKEDLHTLISLKLSSPQVFNPTPDYISELQKIFYDNKCKQQKDSELIKAAILKIVDFSEIKNILPNFLNHRNNSMTEKRQEILTDLSKAISDTRNYIAHAKANYSNKGLECPESEKQDFISILTIIARQCIRWFYNKPENERIINLNSRN